MLAALECRLVYCPTRADQEWLAPPDGRTEDVALESADGTRIHAWWCPAEAKTATPAALLYCHGNAGNLSHRAEEILVWQKELGVSVLIFDYPGYGKSGGRPSEKGCCAAADAAFSWLLDRPGFPATSVILYGASLGGGVAVDLAVRRSHRALVLVNTFTSVPDMARVLYPWLPVRWLVRHRFDNLAKIGRTGRPVMIAHATEDSLVPFAHGQRLASAARQPKEFFPMPGNDHNDPPPAEFFERLRELLAATQSA